LYNYLAPHSSPVQSHAKVSNGYTGRQKTFDIEGIVLIAGHEFLSAVENCDSKSM
jgi:hypothetical protein